MPIDRIKFAKVRKYWHSVLSQIIRKNGWKAPFFNVFFADKTLFSDGEHVFSFADTKNRRAITIGMDFDCKLCSDFKAWLGTFDEEENLINVLHLNCSIDSTSTKIVLDIITAWLIKKVSIQEMKLLLEIVE